jgi:hypothetical protein
LKVSTLHGSSTPPAGWVSRRYHRKSPTTTMIATGRIQGAATFVCTLDLKRLNG